MFDSTAICEIFNEHPIPPELLVNMLQGYHFFDQQEKLDLVPRKTSMKSTEFRKRGNNLYQREKHDETASHRMILSLYTQSVAYAPNGSEELALALSNRSALLLHIDKYDVSLKDIDRALRITGSNDLKNKLLTRQTRCLQLNQIREKSYKKQMQLPKLTRSKFIPCAADCMKLDCNEKFGRHYTATRDIEPGKFIMSEKTPYLFVHFEHMYLTCSYCLAFAWVAIPCDSCVYAIYCSENCKDEAWSQYHDIQCTITSFLTCKGLEEKSLFNFSHLTKTMIIFVRKEGLTHILEEANKIHNQQGISVKDPLFSDGLNCQEFRFIYNLATGVEDDQNIDECLLIVLSLAIKFLMKEYKMSRCQSDFGTTILTMKEILRRLYNIQECNFYRYRACLCTCDDVDMCPPECASKRGFLLAPCSSLVNHSCDPNVSRICIPGQGIVLFTLRPIKKGEQICITYGVEPGQTAREDRHESLLKSRGFICTCKACDENWPTATTDIIEKLDDLEDIFPNILAEKYLTILTIEHESRNKWNYTEELLRDAIAMIKLIYKKFDDQKAYLIAIPLKYYMEACFLHLYGETMDFSDTC